MVAAVLALLAAAAPTPAPTRPPATNPANAQAPGAADTSPEQALRTFFIAMLSNDAATLRSVSLPSDELDWLTKGKQPPADQLASMKEAFAKMPIRALKAGDEVDLHAKGKIKVSENAVDAEHAMLIPEGFPGPFFVQKVDGQWKVDAGPLIAARKAADAVRKKREGSTATTKPA